MVVERQTTQGFAKGRLRLLGRGARAGEAECEVLFQNENLVARVDGVQAACVPDLICCLEEESERRSAL